MADLEVEGIEAFIASKSFKSKDKDPETLLIDFDQYVKTIRMWSVMK